MAHLASRRGRTAAALVTILCGIAFAPAALGFSTPQNAPAPKPTNPPANQNVNVPPIDCKKTKGEGWIYDFVKKTCVRQTALDDQLHQDQRLYQQGRSLALAGDYRGALGKLGAIADQEDPAVLTMIGFATRKLGRLDEGIAIYNRALAIDPANLDTHEYLGEGYIAAGRVDLAEAELDALAKLCSTGCEQYRALEKAIAGEGFWH
jgi:tetratricopeptide (TPR) repeat protein